MMITIQPIKTAFIYEELYKAGKFSLGERKMGTQQAHKKVAISTASAKLNVFLPQNL